MKHFFTIISIIIFSAYTLQAQNIKGRIIDANSQPVDYATVVLQTPDSMYINSAITDTLGYFSFESSQKQYRLIIQHLLYNTKEVSLNSTDAGQIVLDNTSHSLSEVTVKGYRPAVSVSEGKLTYDMPRLLEGKVVSNAYESLLQLPGVREQDGKITLAGTNSIAVILNGKPSTMSADQLMDLLKNTPQDRILKTEIMYSAPPQYHIRGAAINLVLNGGTSEQSALKGQINTSYTQRSYERINTGATLLYSTPKLSTDLMTSFSNGRSTSGMDLNSQHSFDGKVYDIQQSNTSRTHGQTLNTRLGSEYNISDEDKLSLTYTTQIQTSYNSTQYSKGYSNSVNNKKADSPEQMHNIALAYTSHFGLDAGIDYTYYTDNTIQNFSDTKNNQDEHFTSYSKQNINRIKAYADQSHSLNNKWSLNYGGSYTFTSDKGLQTYNSLTGSDLSDKNTQSKVNEYTYNMYAGFDKAFSEKLSLSASIATEYYKLGDFDEWSVFPTLQLSYIPTAEHLFQLSVSSDKEYPDYWEMHGAVSYLNGYTEIHGNPSLRPSKDYTAQLSYIFRSKYVLTLYGSFEDDYFVQLPYQATDRLALIYKTTNFDYKKSVGATLTIPVSLGRIGESRLTVDGSYTRAKSSHFHDTSFDNSKWYVYTALNNTFNISSKPNIKAELSAAYVSPFIQGPGQLTAMWNVDAGIKWTFIGDKAELRLKGSNIFDTWTPDMRLKYGTQNIKMNVYPDSRAITLSFSYKFGGYKNKEQKAVDTSRFGQQ